MILGLETAKHLDSSAFVVWEVEVWSRKSVFVYLSHAIFNLSNVYSVLR